MSSISCFRGRPRRKASGSADEYDRIAGEELGHAEMWLRELGGISDTQNNLKQTIRGEMADYKTSYPNFAHNARAAKALTNWPTAFR